MPADRPLVVAIAGPNGAGKSTIAHQLLVGALDVAEFVNADAIAAGLSGFDPGSARTAAGRVMLDRLRALARARVDFAFETTLASRSFAPWLDDLRSRGYRTHLAFLSLADADLAVARVAARVRSSGHDVPESTVRRRFIAGLENLCSIYRPVLDAWQVFDNSALGTPRLIATGLEMQAPVVLDAAAWNHLFGLNAHE